MLQVKQQIIHYDVNVSSRVT